MILHSLGGSVEGCRSILIRRRSGVGGSLSLVLLDSLVKGCEGGAIVALILVALADRLSVGKSSLQQLSLLDTEHVRNVLHGRISQKNLNETIGDPSQYIVAVKFGNKRNLSAGSTTDR